LIAFHELKNNIHNLKYTYI